MMILIFANKFDDTISFYSIRSSPYLKIAWASASRKVWWSLKPAVDLDRLATAPDLGVVNYRLNN